MVPLPIILIELWIPSPIYNNLWIIDGPPIYNIPWIIDSGLAIPSTIPRIMDGSPIYNIP